MKFARIAIGTFLAVVLLAALFFAIRLSEGSKPAQSAQVVAPPLKLISYKDNYHNGVDQVSGTVLAPTPCTPVSATSSVQSDGTIRVDVSSTPDKGVCLQLEATTSFSVTANGSATSNVSIYLNGTLATTTP